MKKEIMTFLIVMCAILAGCGKEKIDHSDFEVEDHVRVFLTEPKILREKDVFLDDVSEIQLLEVAN
jgi:hypothetical protein